MKLFKRKSPKANRSDNTISERLGSIYNKFESGWANWMTQRTAPLTRKDWLISLIVFVLLMGGYCTYLIIQGFNGGKGTFSVTPIHNPVSTKVESTGHPGKSPPAEYKAIIAFHRYMDSLSKDANGKKIYDSIIEIRPGLMDSIKKIENDHKQYKNK